MASVPSLQEGAAGDPLPEARVADHADGVLVSALSVAPEHFDYVQRLVELAVRPGLDFTPVATQSRRRSALYCRTRKKVFFDVRVFAS